MSHLDVSAPPSLRRSTPRPRFTDPTVIRRADVAHHVWGDVEAGFVTDRVIASTDQLHVLEYELPPGGEFRHSPMNQTVFAGDVLYYVLEGELLLADPETGEIAVAESGSGRLFRRDTWHNGFNRRADSNVRVLEFFSPPPARGTASDYSRRQPPLEASRYSDERWTGRWPAAADEQRAASRFAEVSVRNGLHAFRDDRPSHVQTTLVDTEYLGVVDALVQPGHVEDFAPVAHESVLVVTEGELWLDVWSPRVEYQATSVLQAGDAAFLPIGCSERILVRAAAPARYLRGWGEVPDGWTP